MKTAKSLPNSTPRSAPMERKDSGTSARASPDRSKLRAVPGPQKKSVTFAPTPPGMGTRRHECFHADAPAFKPSVTPITMLNNDSVPDVATENGNSPRPIGSRSPDTYYLKKPMHEGPAFSTDNVNSNGLGMGHYVAIGNIPMDWDEGYKFLNLLYESGATDGITSMNIAPELGDTSTAYLYFDDIRTAQQAPTLFEALYSKASCHQAYPARYDFIDQSYYFMIDYKHPRAEISTAFDGQIEYIVSFIGPEDKFDLQDVFKQIRTYAETHGVVRTMRVLPSPKITSPKFRVEYFSIADADKACEPGDLKELIDLTDDLVVTIRAYSPEYPDYSHPQITQLPTWGFSIFNQPPSAGRSSLPPRNLPAKHYKPNRTGMLNNGLHTSQIPYGVAPEYRNYRPNPNYRRPPPSGIHDLIDYDQVRRFTNAHNFTQPQNVYHDVIMRGHDCRTTVMIRNIPNRLNATDLKTWLDQTSFAKYDFSYLRIDFSNNCNVGYAFVNFVNPIDIAEFVYHRVGVPWNMFGSDKCCEISYATVQGFECLVQKFRNSSVMREWRGFRPRVFYTFDSDDIPPPKMPGDEYDFPSPDNDSKLKRSLDNAQAVGLYPPRSHHGNRNNNSGTRGQWDRGTPRAIEEQSYHEQYPGPVNRDRATHTPRHVRGLLEARQTHGGRQTPSRAVPSYHHGRRRSHANNNGRHLFSDSAAIGHDDFTIPEPVLRTSVIRHVNRGHGGRH